MPVVVMLGFANNYMPESPQLNIRDHVNVLRRLWQAAATPTVPPLDTETYVSVSPATRRIAHAYERFRNTLEPEEEDILRRKALYRILERRLSEDRTAQAVATSLVQELIRAHYVPSVPVVYSLAVAHNIALARTVLAMLDKRYHDWFLHIVAVSIDRIFHSHQQADALVRLFYRDTYNRTVWVDEVVGEADRPAQLFIACYRALFAVDDYEIHYVYFLNRFSAWAVASPSALDLQIMASELPAFASDMRQMTSHPNRYRLMRLLQPAAVPYRILWDILPNASAYTNSSSLSQATHEAIATRSRHLTARLSRRAWHSILFLFVTKTILTLFIELPYERYVLRQVHWLALGTNIVFHPLLLFFAATWVRLPGARNTETIVDQVHKLVTGEGELPTLPLSLARRYGPITWSVFGLFYAFLFAVIFWGMFTVLDRLDFSLVAMFFFVIFFGLVSFLAVRIRRAVDEIRLLPAREGTVTTLITFISLPVLEFGRWLARNITQLNVILFLMDRVLEAPFKLMIDVIEDWFSFVRDRKEEIR